jgi:hypothetical protein
LRCFCTEQAARLAEAVAALPAVDTSFALSQDLSYLKARDQILLQYNGVQGWDHLLCSTYQALWCVEALRPHVVFPLGFLKGDSGTELVLLFPKLQQDWRIGLPEEDATHLLYCAELQRIVKLMHCEALVVHLDLMPCNIAWRMQGSALHVQLLDFDTGNRLGSSLPELLVDRWVSYRIECCWSREQSGLTADPRWDAWFCFQFARMGTRLSCSVLHPSGPAVVNDQYAHELSQLGRADQEFATWFRTDWSK